MYKGNEVWIVAESRFEWYTVKYICSSKEIAIKRWEELRGEMIQDNQRMVDANKQYLIDYGYYDNCWEKHIEMLQNLKPGERCDCDYPDLQRWDVE